MKRNKGITLIALIITIIIMLILCATTITVVINSGLLDKAKTAAQLTQNSIETEQEIIDDLLNSGLNGGAYIDNVLVTPPSLSSGMIPVKYDNENNVWIKTTKKDQEWYNYEDKQWANMVLSNAEFDENGILNETAPYSMFVWIPRYAYRITSGWHSSSAGEIEIVFVDKNNEDKDGNIYDTTYAVATDGIVQGQGMTDYVVHPAFNFGDDTLDGFWVGKYETSNTDCTIEEATGQYNDTDKTVQVKAGVTSWRGININNIYTVCTELNKSGNNYGLSSDDTIVDPHLIKNTEWGACAYLSKSEYGKQNREVWVNNSSNYITGSAGDSVNADTDIGTTNDYKSTQGQEASTTGNTYGIYDMSGGAFEYVAAYVDNNNENLQNGANLIDAPEKYSDIYIDGGGIANNYSNTSSRYGDAIYETSANSDSPYTSSWYNDYSYFPDTALPFIVRGGFYYAKENAGMFCFGYDIGINYAYDGFRIVIPVL